MDHKRIYKNTYEGYNNICSPIKIKLFLKLCESIQNGLRRILYCVYLVATNKYTKIVNIHQNIQVKYLYCNTALQRTNCMNVLSLSLAYLPRPWTPPQLPIGHSPWPGQQWTTPDLSCRGQHQRISGGRCRCDWFSSHTPGPHGTGRADPPWPPASHPPPPILTPWSPVRTQYSILYTKYKSDHFERKKYSNQKTNRISNMFTYEEAYTKIFQILQAEELIPNTVCNS